MERTESKTHRLELTTDDMMQAHQADIELTYSRAHVRPKVREYVTSRTDYMEQMGECYGLIRQWMANPDHPLEKQMRIQHLNTLTEEQWEALIIRLTTDLCFYDRFTPVLEVAPALASALKWEGQRFAAIQTMGEMLACFHNAYIIDMDEIPAKGKGEQYGAMSLALMCNLELPSDLWEEIDNTRFMPPMVCKPRILTKNTDSPFITYRESVVLNGNMSDKKLPLDVINILNQTPLALDTNFMLAFPNEECMKPLDTEDKRHNWRCYERGAQQSTELTWGLANNNPDMPGAVYITNRLDGRERTYARAYERNPQGTGYQRSAMDFYQLEYIPVPVEWQHELEYELNWANNPFKEYSSEMEQPENMITLTPWEYLMVDLANNYGNDKCTFHERVEWAESNAHQLGALAEEKGLWKEYYMFMKGIMTVENVIKGKPTGYGMGLDAVCSGLQIMGCLTSCMSSCNITGLIDPDKHADAYTSVLHQMQSYIEGLPDSERQILKDCVMHTIYGSVTTPLIEYGTPDLDPTPESESFYDSMYDLAEGPMKLLEGLRDSWQPYAEYHSWQLPDGCHTHVRCVEKVEQRFVIDELWGKSFTSMYKDVVRKKNGVSIIANVIHSIDAFVMRTMVRRCTHHGHQTEMLQAAFDLLVEVQDQREEGTDTSTLTDNRRALTKDEPFKMFLDRFERCEYADTGIAEFITLDTVGHMSNEHIRAVGYSLQIMLTHKSFPVICVHDEFKCSPLYLNWLREHYRQIMAELCQAKVIEDILTQLNGRYFPRIGQKSENIALANIIRKSNYGLG